MTISIPAQKFDDPDEEPILKDTAEHWRKVWNATLVQAIACVEDAAKQLNVMLTSLQGLCVAIFAFSDIQEQVIAMLAGSSSFLLFFTPLVCWLVSLSSVTHMFVPCVRPDINFNEISVSA